MLETKEIVFATTNKGKFTYYSQLFSEYGVRLKHIDMDLPEPRSDDLQEIAKEKVLYAYSKLKRPCIALDAGFFIDSLNGFPRAFTNFALSTIGVEGILTLVTGKARQCEFRNCIAYLDSSLKEPKFFISGIKGTLAEQKRGILRPIDWSELSLVFIPLGESQTLGEMSEEKRKQLLDMRWGPTYHDVADWLKDQSNPRKP